VQQKTFYKILFEINLNPGKIKQCLLDKRMTRTEKNILECYLLIRNNQNKEAFNRLKELPPSEFTFVEAQKDLLIGISLNNQSHFTEAEIAIWKAIPIFQSLESHYFLFVAYFNLCFIYFNTRLLPKMYDMIKAMEELPLESDLQETRILRCKFNYYSELDDIKNAQAILKKISPLKKTMPESDIISHLVFEFMFYVKREDFDRCKDLLLEMKNFRKFNLSENYNFMKKMLSHLIDDGPIYVTNSSFENTPVLYHQIKVIQFMEEKNIDLAKHHWDFLASANSNVYKENFQYTGTKCLFSLCLEKHRESLSVPTEFKIIEGSSKIDALIMLLTEAKAPMSGQLIYEILWGEAPIYKQDMNKLIRMIYRAKNDKQVEILFHKGTYSIKVDKKSNKKIS
jgi:hypothetical protein